MKNIGETTQIPLLDFYFLETQKNSSVGNRFRGRSSANGAFSSEVRITDTGKRRLERKRRSTRKEGKGEEKREGINTEEEV